MIYCDWSFRAIQTEIWDFKNNESWTIDHFLPDGECPVFGIYPVMDDFCKSQ